MQHKQLSGPPITNRINALSKIHNMLHTRGLGANTDALCTQLNCHQGHVGLLTMDKNC